MNFLKYFVRNFPIVADHVRDAMGDQLFDMFLVNKSKFEIFFVSILNLKKTNEQ
jgi:hypothetical protein